MPEVASPLHPYVHFIELKGETLAEGMRITIILGLNQKLLRKGDVFLQIQGYLAVPLNAQYVPDQC